MWRRLSGIGLRLVLCTSSTCFLMAASSLGFMFPRSVDAAAKKWPHDRSAVAISEINKEQISVADLARFAVIGNPQSLDWKGQYRLADDAGLFSPNRKLVAVVIQHGEPEKLTNDGTLLVYRTARLLQGAPSTVVARFQSAGNFQPIAYVRWLPDSETLVFAATEGEKVSQVYAANIRSGVITQLTNSVSQLISYEITPSGQRLVTLSEQQKRPPSHDTDCRSRGCRVTADAIWDVEDGVAPTGSSFLSVYNIGNGKGTVLPQPYEKNASIARCDDALAGGISPDGRFALRWCELRHWPQWIQEYDVHPEVRLCRVAKGSHCLRQLVLIDLDSGSSRLLDETLSFRPDRGAPPVWIDGGRGLIIPAVMAVPAAASIRQESFPQQFAMALIDPVTHRLTRITTLEGNRVDTIDWDQTTEKLSVQVGKGDTNSASIRQYQRIGSVWTAAPVSAVPIKISPDGINIVIEQTLNDPPVLVATDSQSGMRRLILNPNPWLAQRKVGRVEEIQWNSRDGRVWIGGLYYPPDYRKGVRYPLVIQTHGFERGHFALNGIARNFAGQALTAQGILVLQVAENDAGVVNTPAEWTIVQAGYEAAIDHLDRLGVVDRSRIGMQGWSATGPHVGYFLTKSSYPIAAVAFTDSGDFGWWWYLSAGAPPGVEPIIGAAPFGDGLHAWLHYSPTFNLDRVQSPLLMWQARGVVGLWDWYAGLRRLGKPVEYWFLPDGRHDVFKIGERLLTNQLLVDWFRFWLKSEEDSDPQKMEQYARWREFRRYYESPSAADYKCASCE